MGKLYIVRETLDSFVEKISNSICEECGKKFNLEKHNGHKQRFCSRKCYIEYRREYLKEYNRKYSLEYYKRHDIIQHVRRYQQTPKFLESKRKYHKERRIKLMDNLGGPKCLDCTCDDYDRLQFHHINGDGKEDRKRFTNTLEFIAYYLYHIEEAKQKLQVLCRTCNTRKNRKY